MKTFQGPDAEAVLLAEIVKPNGMIDEEALDGLLNSGKVQPSAVRVAMDAQTRTDRLFTAGKLHPGYKQVATRLCLLYPEAFDIFVDPEHVSTVSAANADRPVGSLGGEHPAFQGKGPDRFYLDKMIRDEMSATGKTFQAAEMAVVRTKVGQMLWERARQREMQK